MSAERGHSENGGGEDKRERRKRGRADRERRKGTIWGVKLVGYLVVEIAK
jgi:hypothetical protein